MLADHIDIDWLREAYRRKRKAGATDIDRQTTDEYAKNLDENLCSLLARAKSGSPPKAYDRTNEYLTQDEAEQIIP